MAVDDLRLRCRATLRQGSHSFSSAARIFSSPMRDDVAMLYAWCRYCDDMIDDQELGIGTRTSSALPAEHRLELLYDLTTSAIQGGPVSDPAFQGLREVVRKCDIPPRFPLQLIDGFAMDVSGRRYGNVEEVLDYCYHVAGVVGVMMSMVMGVRKPNVLVRAADLGIAFQLTNIARDIVEDARRNRVYIPQDWLDELDLPAIEIARPERRASLQLLAGRILDTAEPYYGSARTGLKSLPFRASWAIATALGVYRDIGVLIRAKGDRAWDKRVSTSRMHKLLWLGRGGARAVGGAIQRPVYREPLRPNIWTKADFVAYSADNM